MEIVTFPHSTLRHKSRPVRRVDAELVKIIREMFDMMYAAKGVGLAANQIDLPLRFFLVNLEAEPGKGEEFVFLNPVTSRPKGTAVQEEGCLSLPGVNANVTRPKTIHLNAYSLQGKEIDIDADGLLARVIQHELDHLDGVLLVDRLAPTERMSVQGEMDVLQADFDSRRRQGLIPDDTVLAERRAEWERKYCL